MKTLITLLSLLISLNAFAIGLGNDNPASGGITTNTNTNINQPYQQQGQGQAQGQLQGQGQAQFTNVQVKPVIDANARSRAESYSNSNSVSSNQSSNDNSSSASVGASSVSLNTSVLSEARTGRNTPAFGLGNVYPTAPCMGSSQVGGSGVGFSIGVGTSWTDDECGKRELARSFQNLQDTFSAKEILCSSKYADVVSACKLDATKM